MVGSCRSKPQEKRAGAVLPHGSKVVRGHLRLVMEKRKEVVQLARKRRMRNRRMRNMTLTMTCW